MKESYMKGIARRYSPELCLDAPQRRGEALTGGRTGAVLKTSKGP